MIEWLWIDTDNAIRVRRLRDAVTGTAVADATITADVLDAAGTAVAEGIAFEAVEGQAGDYVGTVPEATVLTVGAAYTVVVTIRANGYTVTYRIPVRAGYHRGT